MRLSTSAAILAAAAGLFLATEAGAATTANGLAMNGLAMNGLAMNGLAMNGLSANGLAMNGLSANGLSANGLATNGTQAGTVRVKAVILQDGSSVSLK